MTNVGCIRDELASPTPHPDMHLEKLYCVIAGNRGVPEVESGDHLVLSSYGLVHNYLVTYLYSELVPVR